MNWLKNIADKLGISESTQGVIASATRGVLVVALAVLAVHALIDAASGNVHAAEVIAAALITTVLAVWGSPLLSIVTITLSAIVAFLVSMMLSASKVNADEIKDGWLPAAGAFLYVERERLYSHVCKDGDPRGLNSNLGVDVTAWKHGPLQWHVEFTHHSCAFSPDAPDYNALGAGLKWEFYRK